jgi:hypothetical protein
LGLAEDGLQLIGPAPAEETGNESAVIAKPDHPPAGAFTEMPQPLSHGGILIWVEGMAPSLRAGMGQSETDQRGKSELPDPVKKDLKIDRGGSDVYTKHRLSGEPLQDTALGSDLAERFRRRGVDQKRD